MLCRRPHCSLRGTLLLLLACFTSLAHGAEADARRMPIYRCSEGGVVTYSDRPCGPSIEAYSWSTSEPTPTPTTAPAKAARPRESAEPRARRTRAARPAARAETRGNDCQRVASELRQLKSRMRAGYGVAEGERLRDRQRAARARQQELRCRSP